MIRVKNEVVEKREMMIQIQGRINKMKSDEERTKRHIAMARRQSDFIVKMQKEKEREREEKIRLAMENAEKEEQARRKLIQDRRIQNEQLHKMKIEAR